MVISSTASEIPNVIAANVRQRSAVRSRDCDITIERWTQRCANVLAVVCSSRLVDLDWASALRIRETAPT